MQHPEWLWKLTTASVVESVEKAVHEAEAKTAGEIVPIIVRRSVGSGSAVHFLTVIFLMLGLLVLFLVHPNLSDAYTLDIVMIATAVLVLFARVLAKFEPIERFLISDAEKTRAVMERAELEFHRTGIPATTGRTGILIFLSVFEHRAVVLGDHAISEKMTEKAWLEVVEKIVSCARKGDFGGGLISAVQMVGAKLEAEFPIKPGDHNELSNKLIVKD